MSTIGNNIKKYRIKAGFTQEELALKLGYKTKSSINKIEKGENDIPQSKIVAFAKALNVEPVNLIMNFEDDIEQNTTVDIDAELSSLLTRIEGGKSISIHGETLDDNTKELLVDSLTNTLKLINAISKKP